MSMTPDEAMFEQWLDELYGEHREQAIEEFASERLQSFYAGHPDIALSAIEALAEGRSLLEGYPRAAFLLGAIALEVSLKKVILQPVVYGLVHSESTANLITSLVMSHGPIGRFKKLLFHILREHVDLDLHTFSRKGRGNRTFWEEAELVREHRNAVVHQGASVTPCEARESLEVAAFVIETLLPRLLENLGLMLDPKTKWVGDKWSQCEALLGRDK